MPTIHLSGQDGILEHAEHVLSEKQS